MEKLLVVEDDEVTAAFLADNLEADGFHVATAAGVGEAVRAIEVRSPALVILDVMLEDGNGLAVLDRLRAAGRGPRRADGPGASRARAVRPGRRGRPRARLRARGRRLRRQAVQLPGAGGARARAPAPRGGAAAARPDPRRGPDDRPDHARSAARRAARRAVREGVRAAGGAGVRAHAGGAQG